MTGWHSGRRGGRAAAIGAPLRCSADVAILGQLPRTVQSVVVAAAALQPTCRLATPPVCKCRSCNLSCVPAARCGASTARQQRATAAQLLARRWAHQCCARFGARAGPPGPLHAPPATAPPALHARLDGLCCSLILSPQVAFTANRPLFLAGGCQPARLWARIAAGEVSTVILQG